MNSRNHPSTKAGVGKGDLDEILSFVTTGNALPLLHEIKHALRTLLDGGEETVIDLGAIPFAPGDERQLSDVLGEGEVTAVVSALGESRIAETAVPGVWRVDHFDQNGDFLSRLIEISFMPAILKTQRPDAEAGLDRLVEKLDAFGTIRQP